jgi:hypothetical protein
MKRDANQKLMHHGREEEYNESRSRLWDIQSDAREKEVPHQPVMHRQIP